MQVFHREFFDGIEIFQFRCPLIQPRPLFLSRACHAIIVKNKKEYKRLEKSERISPTGQRRFYIDDRGLRTLKGSHQCSWYSSNG
jgi:hypothetical protein